MLSAATIKEINAHLAAGDVIAALAPLGAITDLRWNEMPKLEKATLAKLAGHLRQGEAATILARTAFDERVTLRRFARKLVQSLKSDAAPLAAPLCAELDAYIDAHTARGYSDKPHEAALRREQVDVLDNAAELIRRSDPAVFMDALGRYVVEWDAGRRAQEAKMAATGLAAYPEAMTAYLGVVRRRVEAIFAARYGAMGMGLHEFARTSPRLWQELEAEVTADPEVVAAKPNLDSKAVAAAFAVAPAMVPPTIREQHENLTMALQKALVLGMDNGKQPPEFAQLRDHLWGWVETALERDDPAATARLRMVGSIHGWRFLEGEWMRTRGLDLLHRTRAAGRATSEAWGLLLPLFCSMALPRTYGQPEPLPEGFNADTFRDLKTGQEKLDKMLEAMALRLDAQSAPARPSGNAANAAQAMMAAFAALRKPTTDDTGPATPPESDTAPAPSVAEDVETVAARCTDLDARIEFLRHPPVVLKETFLGREIKPADRDDLLEIWRESPDWEEAAFAARALPALWESLDHVLDNLKAVQARTTPTATLTEAAAAKLSDAEIKDWKQRQLDEEQWAAELAVDDVFGMLEELGGIALGPQLLDHLSARGHDTYAARRLTFMGQGLESRSGCATQDIAAVREICRRLEAAYSHSDDDDPWRRKFLQVILARALYFTGDAALMAEARELIRDHALYHQDMARLAHERHDYDALLPLLQGLQTYAPTTCWHLNALWDHLRVHQPERAATVGAQILALVSVATDAKQLGMTLPLVESLPPAALQPYADQLAACLDSTLPAVARLGLTRLASLPTATLNWEALSARAGELLWSTNAGLAKDAAKFLGVVGAAQATASQAAWDALCEGLAIEALPMQEAVLKAMVTVKAKQKLEMGAGPAARVRQLAEEQPDRLGKPAAKLL